LLIIADENITQGVNAFTQFGEVRTINGRNISPDMLIGADALIVRSVTRVDEKLLSKAAGLKFVGTATIGSDHIDKNYLDKRAIGFASAGGCNSRSVAEYVLSGLLNYSREGGFSLQGKSIGIIGYGNIGTKVKAIAELLGMTVLVNDPPLQRAGKIGFSAGISQILECDIITLHVPMNNGGEDNTFHLIDFPQLEMLKPGAMLINSSRGAVVNNSALKQTLKKKHLFTILDVWENEPDLDTELLQLINYGTAHIAGYSLEGKINGTKMMFESIRDFFGVSAEWEPVYPDIDPSPECRNLSDIIHNIYDIRTDNHLLREYPPPADISSHFDLLRKNYRVRREISAYINGNSSDLIKALAIAGN